MSAPNDSPGPVDNDPRAPVISIDDPKAGPQMKPESNPYTIVYHLIFMSDAANLVSMGALGLLTDWMTVWIKATRNGNRQCGGDTFVWTENHRNVSRGVFEKLRNKKLKQSWEDALDAKS